MTRPASTIVAVQLKLGAIQFKRLFQVNGTSINVQDGRSSFCDPPTPNAPERECWYINMGSVTRADFTTAAMVGNTGGH